MSDATETYIGYIRYRSIPVAYNTIPYDANNGPNKGDQKRVQETCTE